MIKLNDENKWPFESCSLCGKAQAIAWTVPDEIWKKATFGYQHVLCLSCFDSYAKEAGVKYRDVIKVQGVLTWEDVEDVNQDEWHDRKLSLEKKIKNRIGSVKDDLECVLSSLIGVFGVEVIINTISNSVRCIVIGGDAGEIAKEISSVIPLGTTTEGSTVVSLPTNIGFEHIHFDWEKHTI